LTAMKQQFRLRYEMSTVLPGTFFVSSRFRKQFLVQFQ
jgi:hypothetical protein